MKKFTKYAFITMWYLMGLLYILSVPFAIGAIEYYGMFAIPMWVVLWAIIWTCMFTIRKELGLNA